MDGEKHKYSGFSIATIGVAITFFAVFIAFKSGIKYKFLYGIIALIGFAIAIFGAIRNANEVLNKLKEKPTKNKQPWE